MFVFIYLFFWFWFWFFFLASIMASFFHDESCLDEFMRQAQEKQPLAGPEGCEVDVLEWPRSKYRLSPPHPSHRRYLLNNISFDSISL